MVIVVLNCIMFLTLQIATSLETKDNETASSETNRHKETVKIRSHQKESVFYGGRFLF